MSWKNGVWIEDRTFLPANGQVLPEIFVIDEISGRVAEYYYEKGMFEMQDIVYSSTDCCLFVCNDYCNSHYDFTEIEDYQSKPFIKTADWLEYPEIKDYFLNKPTNKKNNGSKGNIKVSRPDRTIYRGSSVRGIRLKSPDNKIRLGSNAGDDEKGPGAGQTEADQSTASVPL